jgi:hypothetical protein
MRKNGMPHVRTDIRYGIRNAPGENEKRYDYNPFIDTPT